MTTIVTPVGPLGVDVDGAGRLTAIRFGSEPGESASAMDHFVVRQLREYFAGSRREFTVEVAPRGTPFQLAVWEELRRIPYGTTVSYAELARRVGRPNAVRAVGAANGANPIPIVIPCHRVIGADGTLIGYGGGLGRKQWLLALEGERLF